MMTIKAILSTALLFVVFLASGQKDWELKKEENGIKVFLKSQEESRIKMLKITFDVDEPFDVVASALDDIESCTDWVYACDIVDIYERNDDGSEMKYYTKIDFPWPLRDRDAYVKSNTTLTDNSYTSISEAITDQADKSGIVRMNTMDIKWYAEKVSENKVAVTYTLRSDPGGILPAWAINLAIDKGPIKSIESFRSFVANR